MSKKNQISAEITAEQSAAVFSDLTKINETLKHVLTINLTAEDRSRLNKMGDKSLAFVQKSLEYAEQNEILRPSFMNLPEAKKDYVLASSLQVIKQRVASLLRAIEDAEMVAGSEALEASLIFYNSVKTAAKSNVAGSQAIMDDLSKRFPGRKADKPPIL